MNKVENEKFELSIINDLYKLGYGEPINVSAMQG